MLTDQLASELTRDRMQQAEHGRHAHRLRMLRRAHRIERRAERRMIAAWRRAARLRGVAGTAEY